VSKLAFVIRKQAYFTNPVRKQALFTSPVRKLWEAAVRSILLCFHVTHCSHTFQVFPKELLMMLSLIGGQHLICLLACCSSGLQGPELPLVMSHACPLANTFRNTTNTFRKIGQFNFQEMATFRKILSGRKYTFRKLILKGKYFQGKSLL
jgi:hypothetical protein